MTEEQMRDLVKESGLDWHRGYVALFDGDETNRYAVHEQQRPSSNTAKADGA